MVIKFSHDYPKLWGQKWATLLAVSKVYDRDVFSSKFIEYDTAFDGGHYPLPPGKYIILTFQGNHMIPFTTVRRWTPEKEKFYHEKIHWDFDILIEKKDPENVKL